MGMAVAGALGLGESAAAIGSVFNIGTAILGGVMAKNQADAQAEALRQQAEYTEMRAQEQANRERVNAESIRNAGHEKAWDALEKSRRAAHSAAAAYGASGVYGGSGSPLAVQKASLNAGEQEANTVSLNYGKEAQAHNQAAIDSLESGNVQAVSYRNQANAYETQGNYALVGGLLKGAGIFDQNSSVFGIGGGKQDDLFDTNALAGSTDSAWDKQISQNLSRYRVSTPATAWGSRWGLFNGDWSNRWNSWENWYHSPWLNTAS